MVSAVVSESALGLGQANGDGSARVAGKAAQTAGPAAAAAAGGKSLMRESLELAGCAASIYVCFIGYGYLHEMIYKRSYGPQAERFTHSLFLVFCQSVGNCAFALSLLLLSSQPRHSVPVTTYASIAFSYIGAMYSSNLALNFMSYPAQSLAKSCKLIPVMLARMLLLGKRYSLHEYAQVALITAGIAVFMLGEEAKAGGRETSLLGLLLCVLSLALDGFTGPTQEKINARYKPSMAQMMFYLNVWAIGLVLLLLLVTGQLWTGIAFFRSYPEVLPEVAVFSLLSALGQAAILVTVLNFNSLVLTTVTTTRKFFTILFSVFVHGHSLTPLQWAGVMAVFTGLGIELLDKYRQRSSRQAKRS